MKYLKLFENYIRGEWDAIKNPSLEQLYTGMEDLLQQANSLICQFKGENPKENNYAESFDVAIDELNKIEDSDSDIQFEASDLADEIAALQADIDDIE